MSTLQDCSSDNSSKPQNNNNLGNDSSLTLASMDSEHPLIFASKNFWSQLILEPQPKPEGLLPGGVTWVDDVAGMEAFLPHLLLVKKGIPDLALDCEDSNGLHRKGTLTHLSLWFDARGDADALFGQYKVALATILDVQLMELAYRHIEVRYNERRYLGGLLGCMAKYSHSFMKWEERIQWLRKKELGRCFFGRFGYDILNEHPTSKVAAEYIAGDTFCLFGLHDLFAKDCYRVVDGVDFGDVVIEESRKRSREPRLEDWDKPSQGWISPKVFWDLPWDKLLLESTHEIEEWESESDWETEVDWGGESEDEQEGVQNDEESTPENAQDMIKPDAQDNLSIESNNSVDDYDSFKYMDVQEHNDRWTLTELDEEFYDELEEISSGYSDWLDWKRV
ncbi:hypothetical protein BJ875DRAFT_461036 [Amylocarpus encephaloides]|uniref:Uncharacterized protein n=1 Tax=Amylocarpus encephaloides TaxID=45428 RepID=A0A9P8C5W8_9HELO|nr:hypothetical protein BJ875DRAFT_461036 [Amylocarpus encephaloides]